MRDIKFKAWDKVNKKMLSWDEICEECLIADILTCNLYIPLQYLLTNEDDIDIFIGDIIQMWDKEPEEILDLETAHYEICECVLDKSCKLCGNIYEGLKIDL